mgnify:CR=1 FL=1
MNAELLAIAGVLSLLASFCHVLVVVGGPRWYRFFGAGEAMTVMAEKGSVKPTIITLCIAAVLFVWFLYACSGAGYLPALPFLKTVLSVITALYLIRGVGGIMAPLISDHPKIKQNSLSFWLWSSTICLVIGGLHLVGLLAIWHTL